MVVPIRPIQILLLSFGLFSTRLATANVGSAPASGTAVAVASAPVVKSMNLTTYQSWGYTVDSTVQGARVRNLILQLKSLGFNHLTFNVRAKMVTGTADQVLSFVPQSEQATEERLLGETIDFAHAHGMTTGLRPILLVVGPRGEFPYTLSGKTWWHGNISPANPMAWFQSLRLFHERYLHLAKLKGVSQYTIGAELHSMVTGLGERRPSASRGYPRQWTDFIRYAKAVAGAKTLIAYDINYTDQYVLEAGVKKLGGEFEQFRYEMTKAVRRQAEVDFQNEVIGFWKELDIIGVDMYRALAGRSSGQPGDFSKLAQSLQIRADSHATQLDTSLLEIESITGVFKKLELKEIGYRSTVGSFVNPASYESSGGTSSVLHQAAAWKALLGAFLEPQWPWFSGVHVWETNVDRDHMNPKDLGFSPIGKPLSEDVFRAAF